MNSTHLADPVSRLEEAITSLVPLLPLLEQALVPDAARTPASHVPSHPAPRSRPPWSPRPAFALTTVWSEALDLYQDLRYRALSVPPNAPLPLAQKLLPTLLAALPPLAGHPRVSVPRQESAAHQAATWLRGARVALGLEEPWSRIPRAPQAPEARCPFCGLPSLRMRPLQGTLTCVSPRCHDADGRRPRATLTPVRDWHTGLWEWQLWWRDGSEGLEPREQGRIAA